MGLLITECLGCDVSNFQTIRGKKRGSKLPLQSVQWLGLPGSNAGVHSISGWASRVALSKERKIKCNQYFSNLHPKVQRE